MINTKKNCVFDRTDQVFISYNREEREIKIMNINQSILTGILASVVTFITCFFVTMIVSNAIVGALIVVSVLISLIVACFSVTIYKLNHLQEELERLKESNSLNRQEQSNRP